MRIFFATDKTKETNIHMCKFSARNTALKIFNKPYYFEFYFSFAFIWSCVFLRTIRTWCCTKVSYNFILYYVVGTFRTLWELEIFLVFQRLYSNSKKISEILDELKEDASNDELNSCTIQQMKVSIYKSFVIVIWLWDFNRTLSITDYV